MCEKTQASGKQRKTGQQNSKMNNSEPKPELKPEALEINANDPMFSSSSSSSRSSRYRPSSITTDQRERTSAKHHPQTPPTATNASRAKK
ncbi:hypothetical protein GALMADRAFT_224348 [Galerina marginata CBS 339.88]|uniref:Uncharacterized protein n=1 Tax=Galerina marginata (strain CBS 339.88) TaxID=685588 RepID=A0A067T422_GALM3|nr:hypothetical protein GALMADRAFT_224348 [Galerina marginata CBS 339.88]